MLKGEVILALALAVLVLLGATASPAEQAVEHKLDSLRETLQEEQVLSQGSQRKADRLMSEIRGIDDRLLASAHKLDVLEAEERALEKQLHTSAARLKKLETEQKHAAALLAKRLAGVYKRGRLGSERVLARAAASGQPLHMARYLTAISKADNNALSHYDDLSRKRQAEIEAVEAKKRSLAAKKASLKGETERYETVRREKLDLLAGVEQELASHQLARQRLKADEDELQRVLRASISPPSPGPEPQRSPFARLFGRRDSRPFAERKGDLTAPVRGDVITRFGEYQGPGPGMRGLVIRAQGQRRVTAVAAGEIVFAGPFPGLGKTVIINHGNRYHSVYGHLEKIAHEVGEKVADGDVIGTLEQTDPTLHFELRAEGRPLDPAQWLSGGYAAFRP